MSKYNVGSRVMVLVGDTDAFTEGEVGTVIEVDPSTEPYDYLVELSDEGYAYRRQFYFYAHELGEPKNG